MVRVPISPLHAAKVHTADACLVEKTAAQVPKTWQFSTSFLPLSSDILGPHGGGFILSFQNAYIGNQTWNQKACALVNNLSANGGPLVCGT